MNKITVSAPGKIMLMGEYAVLMGQPCLVTAIDKRMHLTVEMIEEPELRIDAPDILDSIYTKSMSDVGIGDIPKKVQFIEHAVRCMTTLSQQFSNKGLHITTSSEFSASYGFGSSAAVSVCAIYALAQLFQMQLSQKELFGLAYQTILDVQEKGSGFDVAAAVFGGTFFFQDSGRVIEPVRCEDIPLFVGYSGTKADTVTMVRDVYARNTPQKLETIAVHIGQLVQDAKEALTEKDWKKLGSLMDYNQRYLQELGVSTAQLDAMVQSAIHAGAYGAKVSGAGGGDCMITLASQEKRNDIEHAITSSGGEIVSVSPNAEGVRKEIL